MRFTRKNPDGTYRIPLWKDVTVRFENQQDMAVLFGTIANALGAYEELGTAEELKEMKKKKNGK